MTCKRQSESQDSTGEQVRFEKLWRSHSTAICTDWMTENNRIATHYYRTYRFDAPVAMHKVSQHMQNTLAQHQQKREKLTCNPQFQRVHKSNRNRRQSDDARNRRAWANFSPQRNLRLPEKKNVQILTFKSHSWCSSSNAICREWLAKGNQNRKTVLENKYASRSFGAAIPLRSAQTEWQKTIELQHTTIEHIALMHQFQCTKYLNTCKTH